MILELNLEKNLLHSNIFQSNVDITIASDMLLELHFDIRNLKDLQL